MGRCSCSNGDCPCVVTGGDCTSVGGNGSPTSPYVVDVTVDPSVDNQVSCGELGLYVPPASVEVGDTDCILMTGTGFPGDPILATPAFSADGGNIAECRVDGIYVPATSQGMIDCRCTIERSADEVVAATAGACSTASHLIHYDTVYDDPQGMADLLISAIVITGGCDGLYLIQAQDRDDTDAVNYGADEVTVGMQIWVNNPLPTLIASQRFDRYSPTQHIFNLSVTFPLNAGDEVYTIFNIHSQIGATVPHTLPGGGFSVDRPVFLQVTRLGEI